MKEAGGKTGVKVGLGPPLRWVGELKLGSNPISGTIV